MEMNFRVHQAPAVACHACLPAQADRRRQPCVSLAWHCLNMIQLSTPLDVLQLRLLA
jgi:hypothetical protein